jgi:hypothetical protein
MPLETTFHAVVDGTNGNTYQHVDGNWETASRRRRSVAARVKGRTIKLDTRSPTGASRTS